jgi:hypothetical protein
LSAPPWPKAAALRSSLRWVAEHHLGRRNLAPEAHAYLRGKLYNGTKSQGALRNVTSGQNAQKSTTAQAIAAQYKDDEKIIRRDSDFAAQLAHTVLPPGARGISWSSR